MNEAEPGIRYPIALDELPRGWLSAAVGEVIVDIQPGFACGEHNSTGQGVPHIRPMNISREGCIDLSEVKYVSPNNPLRLRRGDVLFNNTNSPALVGKTAPITADEKWAFSNHMTRLGLPAGMNNRFVAFQLHYLWMSGYFRHLCVNHVNQASVSTGTLAQVVPFVLAPPCEQSRISDKIEELFSDLDAGVAALQRVKAKLKRYRAAVLKAAVEGRLTAEWRLKNPPKETAAELLQRILKERRRKWEEAQLAAYAKADKSPPKGWKDKYKEPQPPDTSNLPELSEGWCWATVEQLLIEDSCNGISVKGSDSPPGVPALKLSAIKDSGFNYSDRRYIPISNKVAESLAIQAGDFFVARGNGSLHLVGRGALAQPPPERTVFPDTMIRLRLADVLTLRSFVSAIWQSRLMRRQIERKARTTAGIYKISQRDIDRFCVPFPPLAEQAEIVNEVERAFSLVADAQSQITANTKRSSRLRQAILKQAFEGRLLPQDPSDEPASELLERIKAERASLAKQNNKPKKRKRKASKA